MPKDHIVSAWLEALNHGMERRYASGDGCDTMWSLFNTTSLSPHTNEMLLGLNSQNRACECQSEQPRVIVSICPF